MNDIEKLTQLYEAVASNETKMQADAGSRKEYYCPMCGEGYLDGEIYDHIEQPVGFQIYGIGECLDLNIAFWKLLWKTLPELLRLARIGIAVETADIIPTCCGYDWQKAHSTFGEGRDGRFHRKGCTNGAQ